MQRELIRIAPIRAANVVSILYAASLGAFALVALPFVWFAPLRDPQGNPADLSSVVVVLLLYPVFGAVAGWLGTAAMAWLYNLIASRIGGIQVEVLHLDG